MNHSRVVLLATAVGLVVSLAATSCGLRSIAGSGDPETATYEFDDFTELDISGTFDVEVTVEPGAPTVEVTVDDNLIDDLDITVRNGELSIGFKNGRRDLNISPTALVTMPELRAIDVSGASSVTTNAFTVDSFQIDASGASGGTVRVTAQRLAIDTSGASRLELIGSSTAMEFDASGASRLEMADFETGTADGDLSGAASVEIGEIDSFRGDLSGGATLTVPERTDISADISGGSEVERKG